MKRDKLFLLKADFEDPAYPGKRFYCWHCALLEGILVSFPHLASRFDVERVAWPRPRQDVVSVVGEANQSLPLLVLADDAPDHMEAAAYEGGASSQIRMKSSGRSRSGTAFPSRTLKPDRIPTYTPRSCGEPLGTRGSEFEQTHTPL